MSEQRLSAAAARSVVERAIRDTAPEVTGYRLTPPLPERFPPAGAPALVYFAYSARATRGGMIQHEIHSPAAMVTLAIDAAPPQATVTRLTGGALGQEPDAVAGLTRADLDAAVEALFRLLTGGTPRPEDEQLVRTVYDRWRRENALIAAAVTTRAPALFRWLDGR
jgi:hypothetical protein